jgi:hypothetical protein
VRYKLVYDLAGLAGLGSPAAMWRRQQEVMIAYGDLIGT